VHRSLLLLAALTFILIHPSFSAAAGSAAIRGTVLDPDGGAVAGARVLLTARSTVAAVGATDEGGRFELGSLPADRYDVLVSREGFRAAPVSVDLADGEVRAVTIRLLVSPVAESVVVSAAHVDQPLSRTPATTTVVTRDDVRVFQHASVAAALRRVPGLAVARNGGDGAVTSIFSRGGESDFTAVVIDGVPVNAFGGSFDFGHLTTGNVERLEIVRGPQSALWSGGAIGGVVQVITRPDAGRMFEALAEGGARESYRGRASAAVPAGRWHVSFGGERAASQGFTGMARNGDQVTNDDWRSEHVSAGARHNGAARLQFSSRFERNERGNPGPFGSDPGGTYPGLDRISRGVNRTALLGVSASRAWSWFRPAVHASWYRVESDFDSPFGASAAATRRLDGRAQTDVRLGDAFGATLGGEWLREEATSTLITGTIGNPVPIERSIASLFAEGRYDAGVLLITAGARLERIRRERLDADPNPFAPRPVLPVDTTLAVTPRVSAAWFARPAGDRGEWTRVRASAGLGIRPPDAFELAFTDNPGLKPERSRSVEAGVEHALARGRVIAEATAFANRYDDLIVTVGRSLVNASQYQSDNISNARSRGIELLVSGRAGRSFRAALAYTYLDAEVLSVDRLGIAPPPFVAGDPLLRRPRHHGWAEASWHGSAATLFVTAGARGRTLDIDPSFGAFGGLFENPGYASVDAGGAWHAGRGLEVFGRVTNLFDRGYEEVLGFPAPRRSLYAGVRFRVD
jgi:outer membrane cobalamin receptor